MRFYLWYEIQNNLFFKLQRKIAKTGIVLLQQRKTNKNGIDYDKIRTSISGMNIKKWI
jgi:hypothetical protein